MADALPARLQEERKVAVTELEEKLSAWEKFQDDYKSLEKTLKFLPGKVSHDIMVPFGSLAFMPGKLIHTNEILVLLGDNWFAERSASQAVEIVKRRQKSIKENIKSINSEIDFFSTQLNLAQEMSKNQDEIVEIKEELQEDDKEPVKGQRVAHKKSREFAPKKVKKIDPHSLKDNLPQEVQDLFAKLDKLETQESINQELDQSDSDGEAQIDSDNDNNDELMENTITDKEHKKSTAKRSGVTFSHDVKTASEDSDDSEEDTNKTIVVNFTNPPSDKATELSFTQDSINTPTDIYDKINQQPKSILKSPSFETETHEKPKSILKTPSFEMESHGQPVSALHHTQPIETHPLPHGNEEAPNVFKAFSGKIIDRTTANPETVSISKTTKSEPKRVSKFKAQRKK